MRRTFLAVVALSWSAAGAADKSKVDGATKQVEKGAKRIGQGQVGPGFKEIFLARPRPSCATAGDVHRHPGGSIAGGEVLT